jgi:hypothetical protein
MFRQALFENLLFPFRLHGGKLGNKLQKKDRDRQSKYRSDRAEKYEVHVYTPVAASLRARAVHSRLGLKCGVWKSTRRNGSNPGYWPCENAPKRAPFLVNGAREHSRRIRHKLSRTDGGRAVEGTGLEILHHVSLLVLFHPLTSCFLGQSRTRTRSQTVPSPSVPERWVAIWVAIVRGLFRFRQAPRVFASGLGRRRRLSNPSPPVPLA